MHFKIRAILLYIRPFLLLFNYELNLVSAIPRVYINDNICIVIHFLATNILHAKFKRSHLKSRRKYYIISVKNCSESKEYIATCIMMF